MPAILDSLFHKVVNTTSSPIGVEGGGGGEPRSGGEPQSGGTFRYKFFYGQVALIQGVFSPIYHKM